jgi:hypothetical protein
MLIMQEMLKILVQHLDLFSLLQGEPSHGHLVNNVPYHCLLTLRWPWGIITSVSPGVDVKVRVVKVTKIDDVYERSIREICPLPFEPAEDQ